MPTYDYRCAACGTIEIQQSMRDAPLTRCPQCKGRRFERLISGGAGVIFKGDGFWETDYNRSADYQAKAKADTAAPDKAVPAPGKTAPAPDKAAPAPGKTASAKPTPPPAAPAKPRPPNKPQAD